MVLERRRSTTVDRRPAYWGKRFRGRGLNLFCGRGFYPVLLVLALGKLM
jgi:hypothetical protein